MKFKYSLGKFFKKTKYHERTGNRSGILKRRKSHKFRGMTYRIK